MKTNFKLLYLFIGLGLLSCGGSEEPTEENVNASFEFQSEEIFVDAAVSFTNTSSGIDQSTVFNWDFGDGNTSTQKNPVHTYTEIGTGIYKVELKVSNGSSESNFSKEISINYVNDIEGRKTLTEKLSDNKILTCAHRGHHQDVPENSLKSIEEAINEQIEMVEIDVRQTKDGKLVVIHDKTLDRTTNGFGNVADFTLEELKVLKLKNTRGVLTNEKIPTLQEALALGRGEIFYSLDISDNKVSFDKIYPIVKQYGMIKQSLFYTQGVSITKSALNKDADVIAMPIISDEDRLSQFELVDNVKVVHFQSQTFNQALVDRAKAKGWFIFMNAYVNSTKTPVDDSYNEVDKISLLAGNIIQTDYPVLVKKHLE
jgi:PKD repeat protein